MFQGVNNVKVVCGAEWRCKLLWTLWEKKDVRTASTLVLNQRMVKAACPSMCFILWVQASLMTRISRRKYEVVYKMQSWAVTNCLGAAQDRSDEWPTAGSEAQPSLWCLWQFPWWPHFSTGTHWQSHNKESKSCWTHL